MLRSASDGRAGCLECWLRAQATFCIRTESGCQHFPCGRPDQCCGLADSLGKIKRVSPAQSRNSLPDLSLVLPLLLVVSQPMLDLISSRIVRCAILKTSYDPGEPGALGMLSLRGLISGDALLDIDHCQ